MKEYNQLPDKQLIEFYNSGDMYAFDELYKRHKDKLMGFFMECAGRRKLSPHVCEDLLQITYESLLKNITFKENSIRRLDCYIMTIAFHTWSAYTEQEKKIKKDKADWAKSPIHQKSVPAEGNEEKKKVISIDIDELFESVGNERMEKALRLKWQEGLEYKDIAKEMGYL